MHELETLHMARIILVKVEYQQVLSRKRNGASCKSVVRMERNKAFCWQLSFVLVLLPAPTGSLKQGDLIKYSITVSRDDRVI